MEDSGNHFWGRLVFFVFQSRFGVDFSNPFGFVFIPRRFFSLVEFFITPEALGNVSANVSKVVDRYGRIAGSFVDPYKTIAKANVSASSA